MSSLLDDSDDDSITELPTFATKRRRTAEEKSRQNAWNYLDDALAVEKDRLERQMRIQRIKQEQTQPESQSDDEGHLRRAQAMATQESESAGAARATIQNVICGIDGLQGHDGLDQDRQHSLASAFTTHRSILLGMRETLGAPRDSGDLFTSEKQLIESLEEVLTRLEASSDEAVRKIVEYFRSALSCGLLEEFLDTGRLYVQCKKYEILVFPSELEDWLFKAACSAGRGGLRKRAGLCIGAFRTLKAIWAVVQSPKQNSLMDLSKMVPCLKEWFGLKFDGLAVNPNDGHYPGKHDGQRQQQASGKYATGMKHFLLLWAFAIESGPLVCPTGDIADTVTNCIVALVRAGLDSTFQSSEESTISSLKRVLFALLDHMLSDQILSAQKIRDWTESTACRALKGCRGIGPGAPDSEASHDKEAWLCLPLMVEMFVNNGLKDPTNGLRNHFAIILAIQSLQLIMEIKDWDKHLQSRLSEGGLVSLADNASSSLYWKTVASCYVSLLSFDESTFAEKVKEDGPRCLATLDIILYCAYLGDSMFTQTAAQGQDKEEKKNDLDTKVDRAGEVYGSIEDARKINHVFTLLEEHRSSLESAVSRFAQRHSDCRRSEYHFRFMKSLFVRIRDRAAELAGDVEMETVQGRIDSFFAGKSTDGE